MTFPTHIQKVIQAYYAERATDDDIVALEDWLREDDAHVRVFAEHGMVEWQLLCETEKADAAAVLSMLQEAEAQAEPDFSLLTATVFEPDESLSDNGSLTLRNLGSALRYTAGKAVRSKAGAFASIAAIVLIGTSLAVSFLSNSPTSISVPVSEETSATSAAPATLKPVATLTATHNAKWASPRAEGASAPASLSPGAKLHPGDRLTLTQGFAEITTHGGAIAILEAPATIELLEHDNAIHLETGKLVGICETESSKGFVVRTPHLAITDLGTQFGVDATRADATEVHVFEGEVLADRSGTNPVILVAEQSARATTGTDSIHTIRYAPNRFAGIRSESGLGRTASNTLVDTDDDGVPWLITTSEYASSAVYEGNLVTCVVDNTGFERHVISGNAYGFVQHNVSGAGIGKSATAIGSWAFSNLPAGRYDVATAFDPYEAANPVRFKINGMEVFVDQSAVPNIEAGPTFDGPLKVYSSKPNKIHFITIATSVVVDEGGTITVTIDNANIPKRSRSNMDSIAIMRIPEAEQD